MAPVQNASSGQIDEVVVISHHLDMVLGARQVRTSFFKGGNNGNEFFLVNGVVDLRRSKLPRIEGTSSIEDGLRHL